MKEDILEQIIEDYYVSKQGWFVKHNIKFKPSEEHKNYNSKQDSNHSDIDIVAINSLNGLNNKMNKVHVISCKSWQEGFVIKSWLKVLEIEATYNEKEEKWKRFRELVCDKWIDSFLNVIKEETGQKDFTYVIAVTKLKGTADEKKALEDSTKIKDRFKRKKSDMLIKILTLEEVINDIRERIKNKQTTVTESTDVGRIIQLLDAAKIKI